MFGDLEKSIIARCGDKGVLVDPSGTGSVSSTQEMRKQNKESSLVLFYKKNLGALKTSLIKQS